MNFDDSGSKTLTVDFDYSQFDPPAYQFDPVDASCECQRRVWQWVYQPPMTNVPNFLCRSIVACWFFVPRLKSYTASFMAAKIGKDSQHVWRWTSDFKAKFPELANRRGTTVQISFPEYNFDHIAATCECQKRVWQWVYQPPMSNVDGFLCRTTTASWVFVPELREKTMTEMAKEIGKKKQSLGRWVADFKREFPDVVQHLQHIRNAK